MPGFPPRAASLAAFSAFLVLGSMIFGRPAAAPQPKLKPTARLHGVSTLRPGLQPHVHRTPPPSPKPSAAPKPKPAPVSQPAATTVLAGSASTAPSHPVANWLRSEDGRVSVAVGFYNDATGNAPVPQGEAVL